MTSDTVPSTPAPPSAPATPVPSSRPTGLAELRAGYRRVPGYLNAATMGLPSLATAAALEADLRRWQAGRASAAAYDAAVTASRRSFARLAGVDPSWVAVGSQVSVLVGLVAAALPDGARVVTVEGEFSSVVFPFLVHADRGVSVRQVPLEALADEVRPGTDLVAYSLVQSADGRLADAAAVRAAAAAVGARTLCDLTQAAGWLPVDAAADDVTVCAAYKWLCAPRGTAFLTVGPEAAAQLRPLHAGWYAGEEVWASTYGPAMTLACDARRFDVSPAWSMWVGTATALEAFAGADVEDVRRHDVGLADALRDALDLPPADSAMVAMRDPDGVAAAALAGAGCTVAARAGNVRIAFHVWNDEQDVELAARALRGITPRRPSAPLG